jgi:hypothetical protein
MVKPIQHHRVGHTGGGVRSEVIARNAFTRFYDANQADDINKRPGWPYEAGETRKLNGGATLESLGVAHLPRGSVAAKAIHKIVREGVDGDQDAFKLTVGNHHYLVVGSFPEDAARDQLFLFDAKGEHLIAKATPDEMTGKLRWR